MELWPNMTVNELIVEMGNSGSFMSGMLSKAVDTYEKMVKNNVNGVSPYNPTDIYSEF